MAVLLSNDALRATCMTAEELKPEFAVLAFQKEK
jgi:hypothetical protein